MCLTRISCIAVVCRYYINNDVCCVVMSEFLAQMLRIRVTGCRIWDETLQVLECAIDFPKIAEDEIAFRFFPAIGHRAGCDSLKDNCCNKMLLQDICLGGCSLPWIILVMVLQRAYEQVC